MSLAEAQLTPTMERRAANALVRWIGAAGTAFADFVTSSNRWILASRLRSAALVVCDGAVFRRHHLPVVAKSRILAVGQSQFRFLQFSPPPGYNIEQLMEMGEKLESDLQPYWNVDPGSSDAAELEYPAIDYYFYAVRGTSVFMGFRTADPSRVRELIPLTKRMWFAVSRNACDRQNSRVCLSVDLTSGRTIDIEITGGDLNKLIDVGRRVLDDVKRIIPEAQASPQPSLDLSSPEIHIQPKLVESSEMGISASELGYTVDAFVDGALCRRLLCRRRQDRSDDHRQRCIRRSYARYSVATSGDAVADRSCRFRHWPKSNYSSGPEAIYRREKLRAITISVTPPLTMPLEEAMQIDRRKASLRKLHAEGLLGWRHDGHAFGNGRQVAPGVGGASLEPAAGTGDHLPADGGPVRIVALPVCDSVQRSAWVPSAECWGCGC